MDSVAYDEGKLKRVAVLQSNYIPWKGYFDIIHDVDEFIFYDEVQFTKNDWRNRNQLIINGEPRWITVPVGDCIHRNIDEVRINKSIWQKKHFNTLQMSYGKSPYYHKYIDFFYDAFMEKQWKYLYQLNRYLIEHIAVDFLNVKTKFSDSRSYESHGTQSEKLLSLLRSAHTRIYVSGPAAKEYIEIAKYKESGIQLVWKDYSGYPEYPQASKNFTHYVSILDLLFQVGEDAPYYIWGWRE